MHDLGRLVRDSGGSNPRLALASLRALEDELDWLLVRAIRLARDDGYDWGRIGRLLGRSRQSARQRYQRLAPRQPPVPPHLRGRTDVERHHLDVAESTADLRRRREFEAGDAVFW